MVKCKENTITNKDLKELDKRILNLELKCRFDRTYSELCELIVGLRSLLEVEDDVRFQ